MLLSWHFQGLRNSVSYVHFPTSQKSKDKQTICLTVKNSGTRESTRNPRIFIPLQKTVSLLASAHISVVSLADFAQKVSLFDLESLTRYSTNFFFVLFIKFLLHWQIWLLGNSDAHLATGSNFTLHLIYFL